MRGLWAYAVLAGTAITSAAFGQFGTGFTISDGNTSFTGGDTPTSATAGNSTAADFRVNGVAGADHLFGDWWYYRMEGANTREFRFANQTGSTTVVGNTAMRVFNFPEFNATLTYQVNATGAASGRLTKTLVIDPLMSGFLNVYNYADFFLSGQDANDTADIANAASMSLRDTVTNTVMSFDAIPGASNFQVGSYNDVVTLMGDSAADNLSNANTTVPAGSDIGGAFQWRLEVVQGQQITIQSRFEIIPAPGAFALLGLGGLAAARRRR